MGYEISLLTVMGISIVGSLSLNLITGFCGQVSLGHAAFVGIGAYTASLLTKADTSFFIALLAGTLLAGTFGVMVGLASLRVRHDFLAITTISLKDKPINILETKHPLFFKVLQAKLSASNTLSPALAEHSPNL